jgi:hypothetical protein
VAASIRAAGRDPVIAGSQTDSPVPLGLGASTVIDLSTREDQKQLVNRPTGTDGLFLRFWLARV